MSPWRTSLGLLSWCSTGTFQSSHCNSDFIFGCSIFKWVAVNWLNFYERYALAQGNAYILTTNSKLEWCRIRIQADILKHQSLTVSSLAALRSRLWWMLRTNSTTGAYIVLQLTNNLLDRWRIRTQADTLKYTNRPPLTGALYHCLRSRLWEMLQKWPRDDNFH